MRKLFTALGVALALFLSTSTISFAQVGVIETDKLDLVIPNAITSSVWVFTKNNRGWATCSGVVIKNTPTESIVLTAKHCVATRSEIYVEGIEPDTMGVDMYDDLAYLKLNKFIPHKTPVRLSNYIPKSGDRIAIVGFPGTELYTNKGTIFITTHNEQIAKVKIKPGCSGGGVFNTDGELIGIMIAHIPLFNTSFLIKLEDIHKFVNVNKLLEE